VEEAVDTPWENNAAVVDVTMLLADSAQVAEGKLYVLGGGLTAIGPRPQPVALALHIKVPWDRANIAHELSIELHDQDGQMISHNEKPLRFSGRFEAGRPAGLPHGSPLGVSMAINFGVMPLKPGQRYTFVLEIDGQRRTDWRAGFSTRPLKQP
jgi:hypothetical protein